MRPYSSEFMISSFHWVGGEAGGGPGMTTKSSSLLLAAGEAVLRGGGEAEPRRSLLMRTISDPFGEVSRLICGNGDGERARRNCCVAGRVHGIIVLSLMGMNWVFMLNRPFLRRFRGAGVDVVPSGSGVASVDDAASIPGVSSAGLWMYILRFLIPRSGLSVGRLLEELGGLPRRAIRGRVGAGKSSSTSSSSVTEVSSREALNPPRRGGSKSSSSGRKSLMSEESVFPRLRLRLGGSGSVSRSYGSLAAPVLTTTENVVPSRSRR